MSGRLRVAALLLAVVAAVLAALTRTGPAPLADTTMAIEWQASLPAWEVREVGVRGRSLVLAYVQDSCGERGTRASVSETSTDVTIHVTSEKIVFPPGDVPPCLPPREAALTAALAHPLAGRPIRGRTAAVLANPRSAFGYRGANHEPVSMPRLIGLSPADALQALSFGYLKGRLLVATRTLGRRRVLTQQPAPGAMTQRGRLVMLHISGR